MLKAFFPLIRNKRLLGLHPCPSRSSINLSLVLQSGVAYAIVPQELIPLGKPEGRYFRKVRDEVTGVSFRFCFRLILDSLWRLLAAEQYIHTAF